MLVSDYLKLNSMLFFSVPTSDSSYLRHLAYLHQSSNLGAVIKLLQHQSISIFHRIVRPQLLHAAGQLQPVSFELFRTSGNSSAPSSPPVISRCKRKHTTELFFSFLTDVFRWQLSSLSSYSRTQSKQFSS